MRRLLARFPLCFLSYLAASVCGFRHAWKGCGRAQLSPCRRAGKEEMISAIQNNLVGSSDKPPVPPLPANLNFMDIFDGATRAATQGVGPASAPVVSAATVQTAVAAASIPSAASPAANTSTAQTATSAAPANSGDPNVQTWLNSYYTEMAATNPLVSAYLRRHFVPTRSRRRQLLHSRQHHWSGPGLHAGDL